MPNLSKVISLSKLLISSLNAHSLVSGESTHSETENVHIFLTQIEKKVDLNSIVYSLNSVSSRFETDLKNDKSSQDLHNMLKKHFSEYCSLYIYEQQNSYNQILNSEMIYLDNIFDIDEMENLKNQKEFMSGNKSAGLAFILDSMISNATLRKNITNDLKL